MPQYAFFSQKQFKNSSETDEDNKKPYIYYKLKNGKTVQITEISSKNQITFDDAICLGEVDKFYKVSDVPLKEYQNYSEEP